MRKGSLMTVSLTQDTEIQALIKGKGAWGNHPPIKFWFVWSHKQLIRLGSLMSWIILLTHGKCELTAVLGIETICSRSQICTISDGKWLCEAPGVLKMRLHWERTLSRGNNVQTLGRAALPKKNIKQILLLGNGAPCHSKPAGNTHADLNTS